MHPDKVRMGSHYIYTDPTEKKKYLDAIDYCVDNFNAGLPTTPDRTAMDNIGMSQDQLFGCKYILLLYVFFLSVFLSKRGSPVQTPRGRLLWSLG